VDLDSNPHYKNNKKKWSINPISNPNPIYSHTPTCDNITSFNGPNIAKDEDDGKKLWNEHGNILTAPDPSII
jgi:hypothetical protein